MTADLNLLYSPEPSLQQGFIDKNTGLPLAFGLVYFYSDNDRITLKPVYELMEPVVDGPITYVPLPDPVILSGIGTFQDANGNDVIPYYYPYDANGDVELYYIVVTDAFGVVQFTRQAYPNVATGNINPSNLTFADNFVPNGQFLLNNPPSSYPETTYDFVYGGADLTTKVIDVAPGGWTWEVSSTSMATDAISFKQLTQATSSPSGPSSSPRYEININRTVQFTDAIADLRIKWMDVNKFQSTSPGPTYTFLFTAFSSAQLENVTIQLIKYFGTTLGAGPATATTDTVWFGPITIPTTPTIFACPGTFGFNASGIVGTDNNDFVQLAIRFPTGATFNVTLTDFMLFEQNIMQSQAQNIVFPPTTNGEFILQALSNLAPSRTANSAISPIVNDSNYYNQDGSNLYLPMIMTTAGFTYDYSSIGTIVAKTTPTPTNNELLCDGQTSYPVLGYSDLGIPYARLFLLLRNNNNILFGSGPNFVNIVLCTGNTNEFIIIQNVPNIAQTPPTQGALSTGFSMNVTNNIPTMNPVFNYRAYSSSSSISITALATFIGEPFGGVGISAGTLGMVGGAVASDYVQANINATYYYKWILASIPAGSVLATGGAALYFEFSNATTRYYLWFQTGTETDPAPGGATGVPVFVEPGMSGVDVATIIAAVVSGFQTNTVITVAASTPIPPGAFFTFTTNGGTPTTYTVWYYVGGAGSAPAGASNPIKITIPSTAPATEVAEATVFDLNSQFFATPDLRGVFLRGFDPTLNFDLTLAQRYAYNSQVNPLTTPGTFEVDTFGIHYHLVPEGTSTAAPGFVVGASVSSSAFATSVTAGFTETRPVNFNVNFYIKY